MNVNDIIALRLINQQIAGNKCEDPRMLLDHMGGMQAQDLEMARLALASRISGLESTGIDDAIRNGDIFRTHMLRPTWHFVSSGNIHWILELTAPHITRSLRSRHRQLGITENITERSNALIHDTVDETDNISREELIEKLNNEFHFTDKQAYVHLILLAELAAILCSGQLKGNRQTYSLLSRKIPETRSLSKEESLTKLAGMYFSSHGPATLHDFAWWSGLPVADAKTAVSFNEPYLDSVEIDSVVYWLSKTLPPSGMAMKPVCFLPAFDEYIIGYKERSMLFSAPDQRRVISGNGIFRPVILVDGKVAGIWRKTSKKDNIEIRLKLFRPIDAKTKKAMEKETVRLGQFYHKKIIME